MRPTPFRLATWVAALAALSCFAAPAAAADPASCRSVRMASPGWSDIDATNALVGEVLQALDYQPQVQNLSVPLTFQGLRTRQLDVFLGNWMPAQQPMVDPLVAGRAIDVLGTNLPQARFTLAVTEEVAATGIRSFADLATHATQLDRKLYAIEAGAPANQILEQMVASNAYGLAGWKVVASSDTALQAQVARSVRERRPMVFLAWEPHLMNTRHRLHYLTGGDRHFGPDTGAATVRTVARPDWRQQCPNAARLLSQVRFTVAVENEFLRLRETERRPAAEAARTVLKANPALWQGWLAGVQTREGRDAAAAVQAALRPGAAR